MYDALTESPLPTPSWNRLASLDNSLQQQGLFDLRYGKLSAGLICDDSGLRLSLDLFDHNACGNATLRQQLNWHHPHQNQVQSQVPCDTYRVIHRQLTSCRVFLEGSRATRCSRVHRFGHIFARSSWWLKLLYLVLRTFAYKGVSDYYRLRLDIVLVS